MKEAEAILNELLRRVGFAKRGKVWSRLSQQTLCRVTLRKDRWKAHQYYLDFDISVLELNPSSDPPDYVWHIIGSGYSENICDKVELQRLLNTKHPSDPARLRQILTDRFMPFLLSLSTISGIKKAYDGGKLKRFGIRIELQRLLAQ